MSEMLPLIFKPFYDLIFERKKLLSEIDADGKRAKLERSYLLLVAVSCGEQHN